MHTIITLLLCQYYQWIRWLITVVHRGPQRSQERLSKALRDTQIIYSMQLLEELGEQKERPCTIFSCGNYSTEEMEGPSALSKQDKAIFLIRPFLLWPLVNLASVRSWAVCEGGILHLWNCRRLMGPLPQPRALGSHPKSSLLCPC